MAEKGFRSWLGYKEETTAAPSENAVDRIRQLEAQLADLRSRKDITSLSKEEFEILATETAMSLIKTAQQREARATAAAAKLVSEATATAKSKMESAESKAKSILSGAESRGRKYLEAAEYEANEMKNKVAREAENILQESKREATALAAAGRREAEKLIAQATGEISNFRTWLTNAISESERLYRIQTQSLLAAENAISETKSKLAHAFDRLSGLQSSIDESIDNENKPIKESLGKKPTSKKVSKQKVVKKRK
jgi:cell division septum initiation protein DivIVA